MTNQNQRPPGPFPSDQLPGCCADVNSSLTTSQPLNANLALPHDDQLSAHPYQRKSLPEQQGPGWVPSSRTTPAIQNQQGSGTTHKSPSPALSAQAPSKQLHVTPPTQPFRPEQHRLRTFFILFLLMLATLVALGAILGPNLFATIPGSSSYSSVALGATGPFVQA